MTPAKTTTRSGRATTRKARTTTPKRPAPDSAALQRLNRSLETAQDALRALRKDVTKDVSTGTRDLYQDLETFLADARRDSRKFGKALERDVQRAQKKLSAAVGGNSGTGKAKRR